MMENLDIVGHLGVLKLYWRTLSYLDSIDIVDKQPYSEEWIALASSVSSAAVIITDFLTGIINKYEDEETNKRVKGFFIDLFLSKVKNSFFKESPEQSYSVPSPYQFKNLERECKELGSYLIKKGKKLDENTLDSYFYKIILRATLTFDFIYYGNEGVFTKFEESKEKFEQLRIMFNDLIRIVENIEDAIVAEIIKNLGKDITALYIDAIINPENPFWKEITNHSNPLEKLYEFEEKEFLKTFGRLVWYARSGKSFTFEPFTYYLAIFYWKVTKLYQVTPEFQNPEKEKELSISLRNKIIKHLNEYLNRIHKFYDSFSEVSENNLSFYFDLYKNDYELLSSVILNKVLPDYY